ncbi:hypothetical protein [Pseudomonas sp. AF03-9]|uniref:hypothetical protein n=1 Tax=Pseudomonas sp. AF03-9 TaxID=2849867 RepID=UPI001CFAF7B9|nr:hypothetical protein [Pseudomonas sp. AF03-9]
MSVVGICRLSLSWVGICFAASAFASESLELHRTAITTIAMEQVCQNANPGMNVSLENAFANDTWEVETKAEVRRIQAEPAYKPEVAEMVKKLSAPPFQVLQKELCDVYVAK